jgi:hypothetical protein
MCFAEDEDSKEDEYSEEEELAMIAQRRKQIEEYLVRQQVTHGEIGQYPAFHFSPYLYLFAIESLIEPGWIGWWAICGDCPCDYTSSEDCSHPRDALRTFGERWVRPEMVRFSPGPSSLELQELLKSRGEFLLELAAVETLFEE